MALVKVGVRLRLRLRARVRLRLRLRVPGLCAHVPRHEEVETVVAVVHLEERLPFSKSLAIVSH